MKAKDYIIQSILAGICIAIGGAIFLAVDNKIIGSFFFGLGLFAICTRGYHLFTGRVAYALDNPLSYSLWLIITWFGNLAGTALVALLLSCTRQGAAFSAKALDMCNTKLNDSMLSIFILAIFCNMLVYMAVDGYKKNPHELGKYIGLFICVAGFILAGFEHCVANMFYFSMAGVWSTKAVMYMLVMTAGNIAGGLAIPVAQKFLN